MQKQFFTIEVIFFFSLFVFSGLRMTMLMCQVGHYLRENYFEKWKEITTYLGIGPGMGNSYRAFKFIFSAEDFGDNQLVLLKSKSRKAIIFFLTGVIAIPIMMTMTVILAKGK